jgi:hypothetical protein
MDAVKPYEADDGNGDASSASANQGLNDVRSVVREEVRTVLSSMSKHFRNQYKLQNKQFESLKDDVQPATRVGKRDRDVMIEYLDAITDHLERLDVSMQSIMDELKDNIRPELRDIGPRIEALSRAQSQLSMRTSVSGKRLPCDDQSTNDSDPSSRSIIVEDGIETQSSGLLALKKMRKEEFIRSAPTIGVTFSDAVVQFREQQSYNHDAHPQQEGGLVSQMDDDMCADSERTLSRSATMTPREKEYAERTQEKMLLGRERRRTSTNPSAIMKAAVDAHIASGPRKSASRSRNGSCGSIDDAHSSKVLPEDVEDIESDISDLAEWDESDEICSRSIIPAWYMLSPDGKWRACIDVGFAMLVLVELATLPLRIAYDMAFDWFSEAWQVYDTIASVLFSMDTASNLLTGYVDFGSINFHLAVTASRYLRAWGPVDAVATTVTLGMAVNSFGRVHSALSEYGLSGREIAAFRLLRLFRLPSVSRRIQQHCASRCYIDYEAATAIRKLLIMTIAFLAIVHIFACWMLWIAEVALHKDERRHGNWLELLEKSEPSVQIPEEEYPLWTYIAALHFSVASVVGNDTTIQVYLPREIAFTIFVHMVAFLITAFFTASVVSFFQEKKRK